MTPFHDDQGVALINLRYNANFDEPQPDGAGLTVFGEVVEGMETVKQLEAAGSQRGKPKEKLVIETATITTQ